MSQSGDESKSHRIKVSMYQSLYERVKAVALNIGMPTATVISMMITDTILKDLPIIPDGITKLTDERKEKKEVNVTISDNVYDEIIKKVDEISHYHMRDYVVDCIIEQLKGFNHIENATLNADQRQRKRINHSINSNDGKKRYSEKIRKQYKDISPMDGYIKDFENLSDVKSGYVKKYFLSKQINQVLDEYTGEFSELIVSDDDWEI